MNGTLRVAATVIALSVAIPATASAAETDGPTITVNATCTAVTVTTSGWPEGSSGMFGLGSRPPWDAPVNGTAVFVLQVPWQQYNGVAWDVYLHGPDMPDQEQLGSLDCAPTAAPVVPIVMPSADLVGPTQSITPGLWNGIQNAPPW